MIYLLDTNIFRKLLDHFPKQGMLFEEIWDKIDQEINAGNLLSVDECFNEIENHYSEDSDNYQWIKQRKSMFLNPTNEESLIIKELFKDRKMQESIHQKNIIIGRPSADIYLAAKAKALNATLVTSEEFKPNSAQLPNICEKIGVDYISYDEFMKRITG